MTRLTIIGIVIAATAWAAYSLLHAPTPPITPVATALTADELYQQELVAAQRTCVKVNKLLGDMTVEGPFTEEECLSANRSCVRRWGPHAVYDGATDSNNLNICACDANYEWLNIDGTIGITLRDGSVFNIIDGLGRCVVQQ